MAYNFPTQTLTLLADAIGVNNIYDAALVCKTIITNHRSNPLSIKNVLTANFALAPSYWNKIVNRMQKRLRRF